MSNNVSLCKNQVEMAFIPAGIDAEPRFSIKQAISTIRVWMERGRQRQHLAELDDRLLADVGLTREQVEYEISKPFWVE